MGLFDVSIKRKVNTTNTKSVLSYFETAVKGCSKQTVETTKEELSLEKFKVENSVLRYNLKINVTSSEIAIEGELQDVWMIVIFIALGILFTYGVGLIVVVAFVYYQKVVATRYFNALINKLQQKVS
jgi:hypothetical protein